MYTHIIITTVYQSKGLRDFTEALEVGGGKCASIMAAAHCLKCVYSLHAHPAAAAADTVAVHATILCT